MNEVDLYVRSGLEEFVASNKEQYIAIANDLIDSYHGKRCSRMERLKERIGPHESLTNITTYKKKDNNVAKEIYEYVAKID